MSTAMATHNHGARIDPHRVTLIAQESCATEGLCCNGNCNQGRDCPRRQVVSDGEKVAGVLLAVSIGLVGAFSLIVWWTT